MFSEGMKELVDFINVIKDVPKHYYFISALEKKLLLQKVIFHFILFLSIFPNYSLILLYF